MKLAYMAYRNRIQVYELDHVLIGLNFTADQMFWIAEGLYSCYALETFLVNDTTVISPFINLEGFAANFPCYAEQFLYVEPCAIL